MADTPNRQPVASRLAGLVPESDGDKPIGAAERRAALAMLPLRGFIGVTFIFAGLQKLANPNFFNKASPISIWSQLVGAERTSPIHALLGHLLRVATPLGVVIALGEVAIGIGVLAGLMTRVAALGGMALSFGLFLTVSFHSNPYYTGADIVFFFAFTPLLIAGAGPVLALDPLIQRQALRQAGRHGQLSPRHAQTVPRTASRAAPAPSYAERVIAGQHVPAGELQVARRQLLARALGGAAGVAALAAGLDAVIGRLVGGARPSAGPRVLQAGAPSTTTTPQPGPRPSSTGAGTTTPSPPSTTAAPGGGATTSTSSSTPPGSAIGPASQVPVGGAAQFQDPGTGDPALVIQLKGGDFVAYDAICPHAGCTVGYSASNALIVCPCHGSEFDPSTGAVLAGPAAQGLRPISVTEAADGTLYAV